MLKFIGVKEVITHCVGLEVKAITLRCISLQGIWL